MSPNKLVKFGIALTVVWGLLYLSLAAGVVYVVYHFVSKFW